MFLFACAGDIGDVADVPTSSGTGGSSSGTGTMATSSGGAQGGAGQGGAGQGGAGQGGAGQGGSTQTGTSSSTGTGGAGQGGTTGQGGQGGMPPPPPLDLGKVTWLHTNPAGWSETVKLSKVTFKSSQICLEHDITGKGWPTAIVNVEVIANPWVFIWRDSKWYGATWEWLKAGPPVQTCKNKSSVAGDHIKQAPFNKPPYQAPKYWQPSSGETLYFMVSGFARAGKSNVKERSNPVQVTWP